MIQKTVGIACVGAGAWGKNQVRVFASLPGCRLKYIVDTAPATLQQMRVQYPACTATADLRHVLDDPEIQGVVIASPAPTHYAAARAALLADKDVFLEKPMVLDIDEGEELLRLAAGRRRLIQVGHLLLFHPAVAYMKNLLRTGELGTVYYAYTQRLNLGTVRSDENALWSLAPHDISLLNYLFDAAPTSISATGGRFLQPDIDDVVYLGLGYPENRAANIHVSWLDPHKTRRVTLVCSRKMVVFDDMETSDKLRIYDKGVRQQQYETFRESFGIRHGDIVIPSIAATEPLRFQGEHFLECIRTRQTPLVSGEDGLSVVRILKQADNLLDRSGSRSA